MQDIVLGLVAIIAGLFLCFQGYWALRLAIVFWGALVGFALGGGIVASVTGDSFLSDVLGWVVAMLVAFLFAGLAYAYYVIALVITLGSAGFVLAAAAMVALNASWTWIPVVIGVVVGLAVAAFAIAVDLPSILLVIVSATAGASAVVSGIMLLVGTITVADFDVPTITTRIEHEGWWAVLALVIAVAGIVSQSRTMGQRHGTRSTWSEGAHR